MVVDNQFIVKPRSYALAWSIALACIPTAIVATLVALLLLPSGAGEGELVAAIFAFMIALGGGLIVLICSIAGVILAIVHTRRTKSNLAWLGIPLNLLVPLIIPGVFVLDGYLEIQERNAPIYPYIHHSAKKGDIEGIKKNLKKGFDVDITDGSRTPLHYAAAAGQYEAAEFLLSKGANADARSRDGETPLLLFTESIERRRIPASPEAVEFVDLLLDNGVDPNAPNERRFTPLHLLLQRRARTVGPSEKHFSQIVKNLVDRGAKLGSLDVGVAGGGGNIPLLKECLETGGDAYQALRNAAKTGQIETAQMLLEKGVDVNGNPERFRRLSGTPLTMAAYAGQVEMVRFLLNSGAGPDVPSIRTGETPMMYAVRYKYPQNAAEIIRLLLDAGADINAQRVNPEAVRLRYTDESANPPQHKYGTALHEAASYGKDDLIALLLEHGADINAADSWGVTALHRASYMSSSAKLNTVKLLLSSGADPNARTTNGDTAYDFVKKWKTRTETQRDRQKAMLELLGKYTKDALEQTAN